ncbi:MULTISPECIES: hypothetical protein [unclassified Mucilaginibacter]|uniref:hypothetical protein n=1 Tax=unclassified Mucilaginibacter TaxID=2617802 RepID=UPI002AC8968E|nr:MULTISPECIES: hypothetical protein [unclassified Mucilaginibacter]MEB0261026.1 hypothetical protein [Mucilaginibacter sp. 10I4]MEB0278698.1 hypothetical protein [Mucilaginibacter sp. 10B2]MEB0299408.1 hypothetical protein [Mucilaginibacter sp. 5C4]WPX23350.1 hypothetical protein RHM67_18910 [Mucilaginibacter sp. 5C4]
MDSINNYLAYIDAKEIADIKVTDNSVYPNRAMFIKLKDHQVLKQLMDAKQLSLLDIFKAHADHKEFAMPVIYILNAYR